tara:strand:+ start:944 stop:1912 length:969 start_codon:yes stop_codon:yes gene_type:complete
MKPKILVTRKLSDLAEKKLKEDFDATLNLKDDPIPENELIKIINNYDGVISTGWDPLGKNFFENLKDKIKIISMVGAGVDNIDLELAKEKNIKITNTPDVMNESVAEITMLLILSTARRVTEGIKLVRDKKWKNFPPNLTQTMIGSSLKEKTLGIIGMGRIGRKVAKYAKTFGMNIIYCNRNKLSNSLENGAKYYSNINSILPECDFLTIHTPLTTETKYLLNSFTLSLLPKHAIVINTSRGSIIDDDALIYALENKKIYAAGLDVYNNEPNPDERYLNLDNCFLLPHIGSATLEARSGMCMMAVDNIYRFFNKESLLSEIL